MQTENSPRARIFGQDDCILLLQRLKLGSSWLGDMLALENDLHHSNYVDVSAKETSTLRAIPALSSMLSNSQWEMSGSLQTKIKFAPDPSQEKSIKESLSRVVSCIQGPPGTGKSQTIIALLDEFIIRFQERYGRNPKILISAFSYAALEVLLHKLYESREGDGVEPDENRLSQIAKMPTVFASSKGRKSIIQTIFTPINILSFPFSEIRKAGGVNGKKISRKKWSRDPKKLYMMGRVFHMSSHPIDEEPIIDLHGPDGKKKTKKAQKKERDEL